MESSYAGQRTIAGQREMHVIDMEMNDIEFGSHTHHVIQHGDVMGQMVDGIFTEPERSLCCGNELRGSLRVSAGEQSYLMALRDQLFGQERNDPFRTSIHFRWNTLIQGGYLGNFH